MRSQALASGKGRRIDAGRVRFVSEAGAERETYFVNVASAGLSGVVTRSVNGTSKALGARLAFLIGTLVGLARFRPSRVRARLDGAELFAGEIALIAAANGRYFGGGMHVAPGRAARRRPARRDHHPRASEARVGDAPAAGCTPAPISSVPGVSLHRGRRLELEPDGPPALGEIDGESIARLPMTIEVLPGALQVWGAGA